MENKITTDWKNEKMKLAGNSLSDMVKRDMIKGITGDTSKVKTELNHRIDL